MYRILAYLLLALLIQSCGSSRDVTASGEADDKLGTREIIRYHRQGTPRFKTLAGRIRVAYKEENKSQSMTVSLRMEKDQKIWIKASLLGITLAKAYLTPEGVRYYETLSNTYFEGDYGLISDWLGTEVDFEKTQAILLGQAIFDLENRAIRSKVYKNNYFLEPRRPIQDLFFALALHPDNFKVATTVVTQTGLNRQFTLKYGPYQKLDAGFFPSDVWIDSYVGDQKTEIEVSYRKIDLDVPISFPFSIPEGYEKIELGL